MSSLSGRRMLMCRRVNLWLPTAQQLAVQCVSSRIRHRILVGGTMRDSPRTHRTHHRRQYRTPGRSVTSALCGSDNVYRGLDDVRKGAQAGRSTNVIATETGWMTSLIHPATHICFSKAVKRRQACCSIITSLYICTVAVAVHVKSKQ